LIATGITGAFKGGVTMIQGIRIGIRPAVGSSISSGGALAMGGGKAVLTIEYVGVVSEGLTIAAEGTLCAGLGVLACSMSGTPSDPSSGGSSSNAPGKLTEQKWQEQVDALQNKIDDLQDKIQSILDTVYGYGKHRVDGSMQELKELMKQLADLMANKPK
jgi:hypothetical protein